MGKSRRTRTQAKSWRQLSRRERALLLSNRTSGNGTFHAHAAAVAVARSAMARMDAEMVRSGRMRAVLSLGSFHGAQVDLYPGRLRASAPVPPPHFDLLVA